MVHGNGSDFQPLWCDIHQRYGTPPTGVMKIHTGLGERLPPLMAPGMSRGVRLVTGLVTRPIIATPLPFVFLLKEKGPPKQKGLLHPEVVTVVKANMATGAGKALTFLLRLNPSKQRQLCMTRRPPLMIMHGGNLLNLVQLCLNVSNLLSS